MNGSDVKWLKEMFEQHNSDQQLYLDTKFEHLEKKIDERTASLDEDICEVCDDLEQLEVVCAVMEDDLTEKITKTTLIGSAGAVGLSLVLWTAFGTNALSVVGGWIAKIFIGG